MQNSKQESPEVLVYFRSPTLARRRIRKMLMNKKHVQLYILDDKHKSIRKQKRLEEIYEFLARVEVWQLEKLKVQGDFDANIVECSYFLTAIKDIQFPKLIEINLWKCQIQSLEPLLFLNLPFLQNLWLDQNRILSLKSFRRCVFPSLAKISLRRNRINQFNQLCEMELSRCGTIVLEFWNADNPQDECALNSFLKANTPQIKIFKFESSDRIRVDKTVEVIKRKFPSIRI